MARTKKADTVGNSTTEKKAKAEGMPVSETAVNSVLAEKESAVDAAETNAEPVVSEAKKDAKADAEPEKNSEQIELLKAQNEMLMQQLSAMKEQIEAMKLQPPQVITYAADTERVNFYWQAPVASDNIVDFGMNGMYGRIVGRTGAFSVPKNELSRVLSADVRHYLDKRWLIITSGLNDEERDALGVDYKEGEVLDRKMFRSIVESGEKVLDIYRDLCDSHKSIIAKTYYETWKREPFKVSRQIVTKLYKIDKNIAYQKILEGMNAADLED